MTLLDIGGLVGVGMMLVSYAAVQLERMDPRGLLSLAMNLIGSSLVLLSMIGAFNLSAFVMEGAWALVALFGLIKLVLRRR